MARTDFDRSRAVVRATRLPDGQSVLLRTNTIAPDISSHTGDSIIVESNIVNPLTTVGASTALVGIVLSVVGILHLAASQLKFGPNDIVPPIGSDALGVALTTIGITFDAGGAILAIIGEMRHPQEVPHQAH